MQFQTGVIQAASPNQFIKPVPATKTRGLHWTHTVYKSVIHKGYIC